MQLVINDRQITNVHEGSAFETLVKHVQAKVVQGTKVTVKELATDTGLNVYQTHAALKRAAKEDLLIIDDSGPTFLYSFSFGAVPKQRKPIPQKEPDPKMTKPKPKATPETPKALELTLPQASAVVSAMPTFETAEPVIGHRFEDRPLDPMDRLYKYADQAREAFLGNAGRWALIEGFETYLPPGFELGLRYVGE
jgi:hypothetical protein